MADLHMSTGGKVTVSFIMQVAMRHCHSRTRNGVGNANARITLAHAYLHIAFQHVPSGHDERYVDRTARRLIADHP
ncbi:hypothetical protein JOE11_001985 [Robbsia andropogonis]|uniref:hypothetical protein n=1 Tax=Robbsia andropogonis TaxID=28092 RepID=UPI003D1968EB